MTVSTTNSRVSYTGNGVQTDFAVTFPAVSEGHIRAYIDDIEETNFSIIGDVTEPNSTLRFAVAPLDQTDILILRQTPLVQSTDYTAFGRYKADQHEGDFDYSMYINQELTDAILSGVIIVPLPGDFEDQITLSSSAEPTWGPAEINYAPNILGGSSYTFISPHIPGIAGIMSWVVYDAANNQRDMNLLPDGTLDIPGAIQLDNQQVPDFAEYRLFYSITTGGAAWQRDYPGASGSKRDAIVAAGGLKRTIETIASDGADLVWDFDPVTKQLTVPEQPGTGAADAAVATKKLVDDLIAASGGGSDPTFDSVSIDHATDVGSYGKVTTVYETEGAVVTAEMVKSAFGTPSATRSQGYWWQTNDAAGVPHNFLMVNDQLSLPALPDGATSATSKAYVDSVAGSTPDPVLDTITFNYQQPGTETVLLSFDNAPAIGNFPSMVWTVPSPSLNNFSHVFPTTDPSGTLRNITFVDGSVLVSVDPTTPNQVTRKQWIDNNFLNLDGSAAMTGPLNMASNRITSVANALSGTDALNSNTADGLYEPLTKISSIRFTLNGTASPTVTEQNGIITGVSVNTSTDLITVSMSGASSANNLTATASGRNTLFPPSSSTPVSVNTPIEVVNSTTVQLKALNNNETSFDNNHEISVHVVDGGA